MEKLDKVIAGLGYCINPNMDCEVCDDDCPYLGKRDGYKVCLDFLMEDALAVIEALRAECDDLRKDVVVLAEDSISARWYTPGTAEESKRIYDSDEIMVDYRDGMLRISQFVDGHWVDEHFVELTPDLMGKRYEAPELRTCYCPICDKHFEVRSNDSMGNCPDCGHHVVLHEVEVADV